MAIDAIAAANSAKSTIATQSATAAAGSASTNSAAALDYNAFLKLLIAQLENQDPMEPMKSSDYVAQLATFSQVEKSIEMNNRLEQLLTSSQLTQAEGLIGRNIVSADGQTTGTVAAARIVSNGVVAVLTNGQEVPIGPGVTVSGQPT